MPFHRIHRQNVASATSAMMLMMLTVMLSASAAGKVVICLHIVKTLM